MGCQFETLADREGFNASVRQIKSTLGVVERVGSKENLADVISELLDEKAITQESIPPLVSMVLTEKFGYESVSMNLPSEGDLGNVSKTVANWNAVDMVAVYYHPDLGPVAVNPKNPAHLARLEHVNKYELLVVYTGSFGKKANPDIAKAAAKALADLFSGKNVKAPASFLKGDCTYKAHAAAKKSSSEKTSRKEARAKKPGRPSKKATAVKVEEQPAIAAKKAATVAEESAAAAPSLRPGVRMTPMYSVLVTNELFHNGNVEAWKKIIESYKAKHPDLDVIVYYDRERITNLNALFKWGKVKRGTTIQFSVVGEKICDVAKLLRYLQQGASHLFEAFLKGPVNSVLPLF
jgi:hypothetical protein